MPGVRLIGNALGVYVAVRVKFSIIKAIQLFGGDHDGVHVAQPPHCAADPFLAVVMSLDVSRDAPPKFEGVCVRNNVADRELHTRFRAYHLRHLHPQPYLVRASIQDATKQFVL